MFDPKHCGGLKAEPVIITGGANEKSGGETKPLTSLKAFVEQRSAHAAIAVFEGHGKGGDAEDVDFPGCVQDFQAGKHNMAHQNAVFFGDQGQFGQVMAACP